MAYDVQLRLHQEGDELTGVLRDNNADRSSRCVLAHDFSAHGLVG
jgi:hypothetical protein